jgi:hypothetical protein
MPPSLSFSLHAFFVFSVNYLCAVAKKWNKMQAHTCNQENKMLLEG